MVTEQVGLQATIAVALDGFALDIEVDVGRGETVALLGPNGAGKSTTVRALTGLAPLDRGRIVLDGVVLDEPGAQVFVPIHEREIGVAFQDAVLFPHLDVAHNVGFGLGPGDRSTQVELWLKRLGLAGFSNRRVADLSGGEARRVSIARALAMQPALVVLDEPFAGLDIGARNELRRMLGESMHESNAARLLITHDAAEAATLADRILILEQGQITQSGPPNEIQQRPASRYAADLMGVNLFEGLADQGQVQVPSTDGAAGIGFTISDPSVHGPVRLTVSPAAVALHRDPPGGSPRNAWAARVVDVHQLGEIVRVHLDDPVPLVADVTPGAIDELSIRPGATIWVAIKATSFSVV